jgi:nucleotide-binding universal stress UspA family protein
MSTHVLVPFDGSELSVRALDHALEDGAETITVLYVIDPLDAVYRSEATRGETWYESAASRAERLFERARERASGTDVDLRTASVVGKPGRDIVDFVADHDVDRIVMGSHGRRGLSRLLLGSVAERVIRRSPVSVTVVR